MQNMGNNPQFNQMGNNNMNQNRGNFPGLKHPNAPFNNFERGSNIFVTSNIKPKEDDSLHVSKLGNLISTNDKVNINNNNNESKNDVNLLQQKRLPEQNPLDIEGPGAKKPKIE